MDRFEELLKALGELLGCPIKLDGKSSCLLVFDSGVSLQIDLDKSGNFLIIGCFLGEVLPGKYREAILSEALKSNRGVPAGTLAWSLRKNQLVLFDKVPFQEAQAESLFALLQKLVEKAKIWLDAIGRQDLPAISTTGIPSTLGRSL